MADEGRARSRHLQFSGHSTCELLHAYHVDPLLHALRLECLQSIACSLLIRLDHKIACFRCGVISKVLWNVNYCGVVYIQRREPLADSMLRILHKCDTEACLHYHMPTAAQVAPDNLAMSLRKGLPADEILTGPTTTGIETNFSEKNAESSSPSAIDVSEEGKSPSVKEKVVSSGDEESVDDLTSEEFADIPELVRNVVSFDDDPTLPVITFRSVILSALFCIVGSFVSQLSYFRTVSILHVSLATKGWLVRQPADHSCEDDGSFPGVLRDPRLSPYRQTACSRSSRLHCATGALVLQSEPGTIFHQGACRE